MVTATVNGDNSMRQSYTINGEKISATSYNQALIAYNALVKSRSK